MSGTSLDGIDIAFVTFKLSKKWSFDLKKFKTIPYPIYWKKKLKRAINLNPIKLINLDKLYTEFLASKINLFIENNHIKEIDAICSHGHTIFHNPKERTTFQIGNLPKLATSAATLNPSFGI